MEFDKLALLILSNYFYKFRQKFLQKFQTPIGFLHNVVVIKMFQKISHSSGIETGALVPYLHNVAVYVLHYI